MLFPLVSTQVCAFLMIVRFISPFYFPLKSPQLLSPCPQHSSETFLWFLHMAVCCRENWWARNDQPRCTRPACGCGLLTVFTAPQSSYTLTWTSSPCLRAVLQVDVWGSYLLFLVLWLDSVQVITGKYWRLSCSCCGFVAVIFGLVWFFVCLSLGGGARFTVQS